jgi:predicted dehydrogenase
VKLMEAFMYRFHPRVDRLLELVRAGTIGEPRMVRSAFTFRLTRPDNIRLIPELGGGALMDVGCYCVNVSRTVLGEEPIEVQAIARWSTTGVDEQLGGLMRFPSDAMAYFDCALTLERREICEVAGTDGHLHVPSAFLPGKGDVPILEQHGRSDEIRHTVKGTDQYVHMVEHFADCALNDGELRYPVADAIANMRVIDALYRSARGGGRPEPVSRGTGNRNGVIPP